MPKGNKSNPEENLEIGRLLRAARDSKHMTRETLASKIDMSFGQITLIELGRSKASISTLLGYCTALDMTPNEILTPDANKRERQIIPELKSCLLSLLCDMSEEKQKQLFDLLLDTICLSRNITISTEKASL